MPAVSTLPSWEGQGLDLTTVGSFILRHLVKVKSELSEEEIAQRIAEAGYTPEALAR